MKKYRNYNKANNGFLTNILGYILTSVILPLFIKMVKRKLEENQRILCYKCKGKLEEINKNEYYCKNCKIIRMDKE